MSTKKHKLLIVDDEPQNLRVLTEMLKGDYAIMVAKNGEKALSMAEKKPLPDAILLDIIMPCMDGFEVLSKLNGNPITKDIPVIFLSGDKDDESMRKAHELKVDGYLTKPVDPQNLLNLLKEKLKL